ncbi:MAG: hemolysin family protein [Verrucomicrobia bacterium]|nr:hemolysin family protein [Verrucomicrobiota bacterium]
MELTPLMAGAGILFFAGASFFFSLAETALFSLSKWQARQLAERVPALGGVVARLLAAPQDLLATIALGNTFAGAAMLVIALWMAFHGHWPLPLTAAGLLILTLFVGEVLPKTLAVRAPELWVLRVARPMLILQWLSAPLRRIAQFLNAAILQTAVKNSIKPQPAFADEEYRELLELAFQHGALAAAAKEIILQIISLDRRTVREVMRPRSQMAAIPDDLTVPEMIAAARQNKHRRLPMFDETPDTIVGVLNTRALLLDPNADLADVIEFPSFVPESMNLLQLLKSLQRQKRGLAIVLDEFGGTAGLVTMEDILGELLGQMPGGAEAEGFVMTRLAPGKWRVNGAMRLDDFRREHPPLGDVPGVETMGGLLTSLLDVVPAAGESANFRGLKITAHVADERRVRELIVEAAR